MLKFVEVQLHKVKPNMPYYSSNPKDKKYDKSPSIKPTVYYRRMANNFSNLVVWALEDHIQKEQRC